MASPSTTTRSRDLVTLHSNLLLDLSAVMALLAVSSLTVAELDACAKHLEAAAIAVRDSKHVVAGHRVA